MQGGIPGASRLELECCLQEATENIVGGGVTAVGVIDPTRLTSIVDNVVQRLGDSDVV